MSALANAKSLEIPTENLIVKVIKVDSGSILYRRRPAAHGSAHPIRKRTSAIFVELAEAVDSIKHIAVRKNQEVKVRIKTTDKVVKKSVVKKLKT